MLNKLQLFLLIKEIKSTNPSRINHNSLTHTAERFDTHLPTFASSLSSFFSPYLKEPIIDNITFLLLGGHSKLYTNE